MLHIEFFTRSIFYNISLFNLCFALMLFFAGMRVVDSWQDDRPAFFPAILLAMIHQYLVLPLFAFLFTQLLRPSAEVSLAIFLIVCFPGNRFSLVMSWLTGGSIAFSVVMSVLSIVLSLSVVPFIFFALMSLNAETKALIPEHSYAEFVGLIWKNRLEFFVMIVPAVILGVCLRKPYKAFMNSIQTKLRWSAVAFMFVFMLMIISERPYYFIHYWQFFSWEMLVYNISVLVLSYLWTVFLRFSNAISISFILSSSINFMSITILILLTWYLPQKKALWFLTVQIALTHWLILIGVFLFYQFRKNRASQVKVFS